MAFRPKDILRLNVALIILFFKRKTKANNSIAFISIIDRSLRGGRKDNP
jgi:hypothetical protein